MKRRHGQPRFVEVLLAIAALLALAAAGASEGSAQSADFPGWPLEWKGAKLRRVPLGGGDRACVSGFSGVSARFTVGEQSYLFRWTQRPTRTLASVRECYERAGYRVDLDPNPSKEPGWTCYLAGKTGERLRLCETFYSENGKRWGQAEAWMEDSIHNRLAGPFWSVVSSERAR